MKELLILFLIQLIYSEQEQPNLFDVFKKLIENEKLKKSLKDPSNIRQLTEGLLYKESLDNRTNCLDLVFEEYKIFQKDEKQQQFQNYIRYMDFLIKLDKEMLNIVQRQKIQKCFSLYRELLKQLAKKRKLSQDDKSFFNSNTFSYGTLSLSIVLQDFKGIGMQLRNIIEKNLQPQLEKIVNIDNKQQIGLIVLKCVQQKINELDEQQNIISLIKIFGNCFSEINQINN